jgi:hypothetical protein
MKESNPNIKLLLNDAATNDYFGYSVCISGDGNTAVVGAYGVDDFKGCVYIYVKINSDWEEKAKLMASDGKPCDAFGVSVSISGDGKTAVVSSRKYNNNKGSIYIFTESNSVWTQQAKLLANDATTDSYFGQSVSISADGNTIIAGAYGDDCAIGSAYIFIRSGSSWNQQAKLTAGDMSTGSYFGYSVAISCNGDTVAIGSYNDYTAKGSVYIFTRSDVVWSQQAKLHADSLVEDADFGVSVSISGDGNTLVAGAYRDNDFKGCVYVFSRTGFIWEQQAKLLAGDETDSGWFGWSVAISTEGNTVVVMILVKDLLISLPDQELVGHSKLSC